jgi:hypothetical protein
MQSRLKSLRILNHIFNQAHADRNSISHYNTSLIKGIDASLENVRWLQQALGLVKAE